jgi:hypothetical protein
MRNKSERHLILSERAFGFALFFCPKTALNVLFTPLYGIHIGASECFAYSAVFQPVVVFCAPIFFHIGLYMLLFLAKKHRTFAPSKQKDKNEFINRIIHSKN